MNLQSFDQSDGPVLLNARQAAARVGLSVSTLAKMRLTGTGPRYVKLGHRVLYEIRDLSKWIAKHKRSNTSETHSDGSDTPESEIPS